MKTCEEIGCEYPVHSELTKCALHCEKHDYLTDLNSGLLKSFSDTLNKHINSKFPLPTTFNSNPHGFLSSLQFLQPLLPVPNDSQDRNSKYILLDRIWFPVRIVNHESDYTKVLESIGKIHFSNCTFSINKLELKHSQIFFDSCTFKVRWEIKSHSALNYDKGFIYHNCTFKEEVSSVGADNEISTIIYPVFSQCSFEKNINLKDTKFKSTIFVQMRGQSSVNIRIENCIFDEKFELNDQGVGDLEVNKSVFISEFLIQSCSVNKLQILGTEFNSSTDFEGSFFNNFIISRTIFKDFASFVDCTFGRPQISSPEIGAIFDFVTFLGFCSFRSSKFYQGLDIQNTSMKETLNFYGIFIDKNLTNRETFRIIKNSFDKVGNFIEGNRYYKLEMLKHQTELSNNGSLSERILFWLYKLTSDFGQSIIRPIFWFALTAIVYWLLIETKNVDLIFRLLPESTGDILNDFFMIFNSMTKYIIPYKTWLKPGMEFISFIFYIIFTSLIWLVILAIKRHTKR